MRCVKLQVLRNNSGSVEWMLTLNYGMRVIVARGMFSYISILMHLMFVMLLRKLIINLFDNTMKYVIRV